jgi:osmotically-inducible protein OsmY
MRQMHMKGLLNGVAALAAGAAAMYLLDPQMGRRRRALLRDKVEAGRQDAQRFASEQAKRAVGQLQGTVEGAKSAMGLGSMPESDRQLHERVRAELGRLVGRPGVVDVSVEGGRVRLSGQVAASEHSRLLSEVAAMSGVESVDDRLSIEHEPAKTADWQGDGGGV